MAATKVTFTDKQTGDQVTSSDINSLKLAANGGIDDAETARALAATKATIADIQAAITQVIGGAPDQYNTLGEISAALITLQSIVTGTTPDGDNFVDTIQELVAVFQNYPEGTDIATLLAGKVDATTVYNGVDKQVAGFVLDARQGYVLNQAIVAVQQSLIGYVTSSAFTTYQQQVTTALQGKQATLTLDSTPTANSNNPVTSDGVNTALNNYTTTGSLIANGIPYKRLDGSTGTISIVDDGTGNPTIQFN